MYDGFFYVGVVVLVFSFFYCSDVGFCGGTNPMMAMIVRIGDDEGGG